MTDEFGVVFSIVGAVILYSLSTYVLTHKNKDSSHYFFSLMAIFAGTSELLSFFEFTGTMQLAHLLLRFDLSFLALSSYFYLMFADYFREGYNKKFAFITAVPTAIVIVMVFTVLIEGMTWGHYGWTGVYVPILLAMYGVYGNGYVVFGVAIFWHVYKQITPPDLKRKLRLLLIGSLILLGGGFTNVSVILSIGHIFPIIETTVMFVATIFAIAITNK